VVRNSWGREQSFVKLKPGEPALAFAGWLTRDAGMQLLALAGHTVEDLLKRSDARDFRPVPLGTRIRGRFTSAIREQDTRNVAAMVAGEDRNEAVVFSAHWDHLGIGTEVNGDAIYNGAVDNATGCAILLELARAWSLGPKRRRSAVFVAVTAEEQGLLGAQYYAQNPAIPAARTALALNFDGFRPFGRTRDVVLTGAERTTFWPEVQKVARRLQLEIRPEAHPEQGHFYRSDHFAFAKAGIPAFSINMGTQYIGKPAGFAEQVFTEFNTKHYHQPSDEYHDDWDFSGLEQVAELGLELGIQAATAEKLPEWRPGDEFSRKR
jgi:Zn-dependent M28 family amino/carboxypeptidase